MKIYLLAFLLALSILACSISAYTSGVDIPPPFHPVARYVDSTLILQLEADGRKAQP